MFRWVVVRFFLFSLNVDFANTVLTLLIPSQGLVSLDADPARTKSHDFLP